MVTWCGVSSERTAVLGTGAMERWENCKVGSAAAKEGAADAKVKKCCQGDVTGTGSQ